MNSKKTDFFFGYLCFPHRLWEIFLHSSYIPDVFLVRSMKRQILSVRFSLQHQQRNEYFTYWMKKWRKNRKVVFVMILITLIKLKLLSLPKAISLAFYLIILIKEMDFLWIRFTILIFSITSSCPKSRWRLNQ